MKFKTKNKTTLIALFLMVSMALSSVAFLPNANAADNNSYGFITVSPNPVGVGQSVLALFFLTNPSPTGRAGFDPLYNWNNFTVKITSPSGEIENFGPYTSDATGGAYLEYTPSEVGQYKFDFSFPGQTVAGPNLFGIPVGPFTYGPASATTNLTVQQDPIKGYQTSPFPTDYWTRPIYGENRNWYQNGGNWLRQSYNATGPFNPYTTAPNTPHIVWTRQQYLGGVVGGDYGDLTYYQGPTYQDYWAPPLIINGRLYYMEREVPGNGWVGMHCVDLRTGKELWFQDASVIGGAGGGGGGTLMNIYGQIFDAEGANGHGAQAFIWNLGANWTVFDANSGRSVYTIINPPVATSIFAKIPGINGPHLVTGDVDSVGSIIAYYIDSDHHWLLKWNSTRLLIGSGIASPNLYTPPYGQTINWNKGIEWNVTIPDRQGKLGFYQGCPMGDGEVVFAMTADILDATQNFTLAAYSSTDGHELWHSNFADIFVPGSTLWSFFGPIKENVMTVFDKNTLRWWAFDVNTGAKLWGPTASYENAWDMYLTANIAYGKMYVGTYAGKLYCHDLKTGNLEWTCTLPLSGYDTPYGTYPISSNSAFPAITIADGKLYAVTGEHTPNSPYWLGGAMYCVNATTGDLVYKMSGWWSDWPAIADGYALDHNCYDGTIYAFGKGQTAVTVSAPDTAITIGQSVVLKGTVIDKSPGAMDYAGNQLNTEGSPAIADAYMTQWMEYLYQQKPMPTNATGVSVTLSVLDSNNNFREIGTTTSNADGFFSFNWTPDIEGQYTVYASFAGSESYYASHAVTAFAVDPAAPTPAPTAAPVSSMADLYFVPAIAGLFVAVIVVGLLIILVLRKRP
jgi:hypothetical protein